MSWGQAIWRFLQLRYRHEITTPTLIAGVRGTELLVIADPQARLDRVLVYEGSVDVRGRTSGQAMLGASQQIEARDGVLGEARHLFGLT